MLEFTEEQLQSVEGIIKSIASNFVSRFSFVDYEDLVQEGWKIFYSWTEDYFNPDQGVKITTWFHRVYYRYLTSFVLREYKKTSVWSNIEDFTISSSSKEDVSSQSSFNDLIDILSKVLSPYSFKLLNIYKMYGNSLSMVNLAEKVGVVERDLIYIQDELKTTTSYLIN